MARNVTVTFEDGSQHVYQGAPDDVTPDAIQARAAKEFGKAVTALDGGREAKPQMTRGEFIKRELMRSPPVAVARGVKDLIDTGAGFLSRLGGADEQARVRAGNAAGRAEFDQAAEGQFLPQAARFMGNMAAAGPLVKGAGALVGTVAPRLGAAVGSSGMTTGAAPVGGWAKVGDLAIRSAGGGAAGALSAGAVNPEDAKTGGAFGAALPPALALGGKIGSLASGAVKRAVSGPPVTSSTLANALGISEKEAKALMTAAQSTPDELVPGSKLTFAQALEYAGKSDPGVKMLERTVAGGPGGDRLLKQYAAQNESRIEALRAQGAQTYQGAAAEEATKQGDKIGAILRTQAGDERAAKQAAWEAVYGRMDKEGAKLYLPLDEFNSAMKTLGPGTVGAGKDAGSLVSEARRIGTVVPETVKLTKAGAEPMTLAQAVRKAGGLNMARNDGRAGELMALKENLKNIVFNRSGMTPSRMAQQMHEAGYLADNSGDTLIEALKAGGRGGPSHSIYDMPENAWMAARQAEMGAPPVAEAIPVPVPFDAFQRLRRSAGALGSKVGERAGGETEAGVLAQIQKAITQKADDAASGLLRPDEFMSAGAASQYNAARDMTREFAERYKGGNAISAILRKPSGQDYTLTGDEIFRKLWHGGGGLAGDVSTLKGVLSQNNLDPAMDSMRQAIMSEAASKTTAAGNFGAALPKYVESRLPGLQEAMRPEQLKALQSVATDIRNAEAAGSIAGLRGSDTQAKIMRALDAGLLDAPLLKTLSKVLTIKGVGLEQLRAKVAESVAQNKGKAMADMLSQRGLGANALMQQSSPPLVSNALMDPALQGLYRTAPLIAGGR